MQHLQKKGWEVRDKAECSKKDGGGTSFFATAERVLFALLVAGKSCADLFAVCNPRRIFLQPQGFVYVRKGERKKL